MAFTRQVCEETGAWAGRCGHPPVTVTKGERFPECPGCHRGIAWHLVSGASGAGRRSANPDRGLRRLRGRGLVAGQRHGDRLE